LSFLKTKIYVLKEENATGKAIHFVMLTVAGIA